MASKVDAIVIGAGFSGMYMLHSLRQRGLSARVFEAGGGVGGTWYWNRYPGARCDVESVEYQYSFSDELQREWLWSERYPAQAEILRYLNWVADRLDLRGDITLDTRIVSAVYDDANARWTVTSDRGETLSARFVILAVGCLSTAALPQIAGLETFAGETYHTGAWPHEPIDFAGKRVGVIGTGSSGTQLIPVVADAAAHLTVFQRTPNYSIPAFNRALTPEHFAEAKETFMEKKRSEAKYNPGGNFCPVGERNGSDMSLEQAHAALEARWNLGGFALLTTFPDTLTSDATNAVVSHFIRSKIRAVISDEAKAAILVPEGHPFGAKRPCLDTRYFETFNRDDVTLVDVRANPIEQIESRGVVAGGELHELDMLVLATGFDAMTGSIKRIDIRGRDGMTLKDEWDAGPRTYLGVAVTGFPNLFIITGPGSPSVLTNVIMSIEQHVEWIARLIDHMHEHGIGTAEPTVAAQDAWVDHVNKAAQRTVMPRANSWYMGANVPGKPQIFMPYVGGLGVYRTQCDEIADSGFAGFILRPASGDSAPRVAAA